MTTDERAGTLSADELAAIERRYTTVGLVHSRHIYSRDGQAVYGEQVQADILALLADLRQARADNERLEGMIDRLAENASTYRLAAHLGDTMLDDLRAELAACRALLRRTAPFFNGVYQKDNREAATESLALMREIISALAAAPDTAAEVETT